MQETLKKICEVLNGLPVHQMTPYEIEICTILIARDMGTWEEEYHDLDYPWQVFRKI